MDPLVKQRLILQICGGIKEFYENCRPEDIEPSSIMIARFMQDMAATGNFNTDRFSVGVNAFQKAIAK